MHEPHEPPLMTAAAVGRLLGVDTSTVYRMASDGRLPALRVGRQWRFAAEQVREALADGVPAHAGRAPMNGGEDDSTAASILGADLEAVADLLEAAADRLQHLDAAGHAHVQRALPRLADALSRLATGTAPSAEPPP
ncbi:MAG: helix-turn-helix domain-containing protein [Trueperaceae bacterium]